MFKSSKQGNVLKINAQVIKARKSWFVGAHSSHQNLTHNQMMKNEKIC